MKIKSLLTIIVLLMISWAASAQGYTIRLTYNTNLRVANSLTSGIVETAPAGSILQVFGQQDRWLQIDRAGSQVWMAGWVSFSRVEGSAPTGAPSQTPIDNCCFVDRQCNTDREWTDGYWAFQNGQCEAPAQSQPLVQPQTQARIWTPTRPLIEIPGNINNCCSLDRECHSDKEWRAGWVAFKELECWDAYHKWARTPEPGVVPASGSDNCCTAPGWLCLNDEHFESGREAYLAYSHCHRRLITTYLPSHEFYDATDNCCHLGRDCQTNADWERGYSDFLHFKCEFSVPLIHSVPVPLTGSPTFVRNMKTIFSLLKARSPYYFDYVDRALDRIVQRSPEGKFSRTWSARCSGERTATSGLTDYGEGNFWMLIAHATSITVHEACHCHLHAAGYVPPDPQDVSSELPCLEQQHLVLRQIDPADSTGHVGGYSRQVVNSVTEYPWLESVLEKPLSYHQHFIAVGP